MKKITIILTLFLYSCVSHDVEDVRMVKPGMSERELKYYMGEPWQIEINSHSEKWYFEYMSGQYYQHLSVEIIEGKVDSYYSY